MDCNISVVEQGESLTIQVQGTFNFDAQRDFRAAYENVKTAPKRIVVDLGGVEHVDSSALGMLVLMQKKAEADEVPVSIVNCDVHLRRLFEIAHLDSVFEIS